MVLPVSLKVGLGTNCPMLNVYDVVPRVRRINRTNSLTNQVVTAMQTKDSLLEAVAAFCHKEVFAKLFMIAETTTASLNNENRRS